MRGAHGVAETVAVCDAVDDGELEGDGELDDVTAVDVVGDSDGEGVVEKVALVLLVTAGDVVGDGDGDGVVEKVALLLLAREALTVNVDASDADKDGETLVDPDSAIEGVAAIEKVTAADAESETVLRDDAEGVAVIDRVAFESCTAALGEEDAAAAEAAPALVAIEPLELSKPRPRPRPRMITRPKKATAHHLRCSLRKQPPSHAPPPFCRAPLDAGIETAVG